MCYSPSVCLGAGPAHSGEAQAEGGCDEQVHALVEELRGEHAPDEQVVAQGGDQDDVGGHRDGAEQRVAEAGPPQCRTAAGEGTRVSALCSVPVLSLAFVL